MEFSSDDQLSLMMRFRMILVGVELGKKRKMVNHARLQCAFSKKTNCPFYILYKRTSKSNDVEVARSPKEHIMHNHVLGFH